MRTVTRLYDHRADAVQVVNDLEAAGIPHSDISIVGSNRDDRNGADAADTGSGAGTGATAGGIIGGGVGLLAGIGLLAIPGVGPVVAAGWLAATLAGAGVGAVAGAATGGIVGSLTNAGVPENEANVYAEGVRRGGSLVTVRGADAEVVRAETIMDARSPADWSERDRAYRASGWDRFNPDAPAYTPAQAELERDRVRTSAL
ncbi:MAG: general stress protein [Acetobacteraceae bacterium]